MTRDPEKPAHISQEDWLAVDVPMLTDEEFAQAVPFHEVFPEHADVLKGLAGQPRIDDQRVRVVWRLSTDVVEHVRRIGKGSAARVDQVLKDAIAKGTL